MATNSFVPSSLVRPSPGNTAYRRNRDEPRYGCVNPYVDVIPARETPLHKVPPLELPTFGKASNRRGREPSLGAEEFRKCREDRVAQGSSPTAATAPRRSNCERRCRAAHLRWQDYA